MRRWRDALGAVAAWRRCGCCSCRASIRPIIISSPISARRRSCSRRWPRSRLLALIGRPLRPALRWTLAALIVAAASAAARRRRWCCACLDRAARSLFRHAPACRRSSGCSRDAVGAGARRHGVRAGVRRRDRRCWPAIAWALAAAERALAPRRRRRGGGAGPHAGGLALGALPLRAGARPVADRGAPRRSPTRRRCIYRAALVMSGRDPRYAAALAAPEPKATDLAALRGHDVFLVFVESYGTAVLDDPRFRAVVAPALDGIRRGGARSAGYATGVEPPRLAGVRRRLVAGARDARERAQARSASSTAF